MTPSLSDGSVLGLQEQICGAKAVAVSGEGSASRMVDVRQRLNTCCDSRAVCQRQGWASILPCLFPGTTDRVWGKQLEMKAQSGAVCLRVCVQYALLASKAWP